MEIINLPEAVIYYRPIEADPTLSRREAEEKALNKLLTEVFGPDTVRTHNSIGAPVITSRGVPLKGAISLSHNKNHVALLHAPGHTAAGLDIEVYRSQLQRVAQRFLNEEELPAYTSSPVSLVRAWTLKEALYKAAAKPGADLRHDIKLPSGTARASVIDKIFNVIYSDYIPGTDTFLSAVIEA